MNSTENLRDCWFYDPTQKSNKRQANELATGRVKVFLFESLYRSLTNHDLYECFQLVKLLPKLISLDPYILFRFVMILIESNPTESINKNIIFYLETLISKLYINKPDIFVEFIAYFVKHNRIEDAKELFSQRNRFMSYSFHQKLPVVNVNLKCYEFLFNYVQWLEKINTKTDIPLHTDLSFQGRLVNIIDCLKEVRTNHEYFVICLIRILLHYGYNKKAYLIASGFQRNNPSNISAQLLHLQIIDSLDLLSSHKSKSMSKNEMPMDIDTSIEEQNSNRDNDYHNIKNFTSNMAEEIIMLGEYPIHEDKQLVMKNLRRLDPSRIELLDNLNMHSNLVDMLKDLLDGLESIMESSNISRWLRIEEILNSISNSKDEMVILDARVLWHTRYKRFWANVRFDEISSYNSINLTKEDKNLIIRVSKLIYSKLDRVIK